MTKIYVPKRTSGKNHNYTRFQKAVMRENRIIKAIDNSYSNEEIEATIEGWSPNCINNWEQDSEGVRTWSF